MTAFALPTSLRAYATIASSYVSISLSDSPSKNTVALLIALAVRSLAYNINIEYFTIWKCIRFIDKAR
jgi:hypothetical protein